jgi:predicted Zn-dependent peptidase
MQLKLISVILAMINTNLKTITMKISKTIIDQRKNHNRTTKKIKNNYLVDLYSGLDTNAGLAQFIGDRQWLYGDWRFYKQELLMYEKVKVSDVKELCHETFSKNGVFVSVWDKHK